MYKRFTVDCYDKSSCYRVDKKLFLIDEFKELTVVDKMIYAILKEQLFSHSLKENLIDERGIYLKINMQTLSDFLNIDIGIVFKSLSKLLEINLLQEIEDRIYVSKLDTEKLVDDKIDMVYVSQEVKDAINKYMHFVFERFDIINPSPNQISDFYYLQKLEGVENIMDRIEESEFLMDKIKEFDLSYRWYVKIKNVEKIISGKYGNNYNSSIFTEEESKNILDMLKID